VQNEVTKIVRQQMQRVVLKGTDLNLYRAFYGGSSRNAPSNIRAYVDETKLLLGQALDEVLDEVNKLGDLTAESRYLQILKLNARFEQSEGLQRFLGRLSEPIRGSYDLDTDRRSWMKWVDQQLSGEDAKSSVPQGKVQRSLGNFAFNQPAFTRPWTEGFLTTTIKGLKGASMLTGAWVATGRSLYEIFESGAILLGGSSQPISTRLAAGEQMTSGALYWGISAGIAGVAAMIGLGPLGAIALGIGSLIGLDHLKATSTPLRQLEQGLVKSVGRFLAQPVESAAKLADSFGLGSFVRTAGNAIATPISFIASTVSAPFRFLLENFAAPFLQEQNLSLFSDSLPVQVVKTLLLPRSVYTQFDSYEPRSSTLAGREPFVGGNIALHLKRQQTANIQNAISANTFIDETTVYPLAIGRLSSSGDRLTEQKYFDSSAGGRVLQAFGPGNYRISNSLRLALQRRQAMYHAMVTAAAIARPPEPANLSSYSFLHAASSTLLKLQLEDLSQPITIKLSQQLSDSFITLKGLYSKVSEALWKPANWLLTVANRVKSRLSYLVEPITKFKLDFSFLKINKPDFRFNVPKVGVPNALKSIRLPSVDFSRLTDKIFDSLDWALDKISDFNLGSKVPSYDIGNFFPNGSLPSFSRVTTKLSSTFSLVSEKLDPVINRLKVAFSNISAANLPNFTTPDVNVSGIADPLEKVVKTATRNVQKAIPRIGFALSDALASVPKGLSPGLFFGGLDFLTAFLADARLKSLDEADPFKEFQRAYQEAGASFVGFTVGGFVASLTRNPLLSFGASILGGILGLNIGDSLARSAYKNQEENPVLTYIQQSLTTASAVTLIQLPNLIKSRSVARTALLNIGLSFATGGLGPVTQLSAVHGFSNFIKSFQEQPGKLSTWIARTKELIQDTAEAFKFWSSGEVLGQYVKATRSLSRNILLGFGTEADIPLTSVRTSSSGSRFSIEGSYQSKYRSIQLSKATARVLGREAVGRRVRPTDLAEARFTLLHEASHALDDLGQKQRLTLDDLDQFIYSHATTRSNVQELKNLLTRSSQSSTVALYQRFSGDVNASFLQQVYSDELSANVRALDEYIKRYPGQVDDLLKVLRRTSNAGITDKYESILELIKDRTSFVDPGVRYRRATSKAFRLERAVLGDVLNALERFVKGFVSHKSTAPLINLRFAGQAPDMSGWNLAVQTFNADFSDLPKPVGKILGGVAKGIGSYRMVRSGSSILAASLRNVALTTLGSLEKVINPAYAATYNLNSKMSAGGVSAIGLVDSVFIGVDLFQGIQSNADYAALNKNLRQNPAQVQAFKREIIKLRNSQLGGFLGATLGAAAGLISKNPLYGFILGGAVGLVAPLVGFFGLSAYLGQQDLEYAANGHALYDPMQSPSIYLRVNKQLLAEKEATTRVLRPLRSSIKKFVSQTMRLVGRAGFQAAKLGYNALSHLTALGVAATTTTAAFLGSSLALAIPVLGKAYNLLEFGAKGFGRFAYSLGKPLFPVVAYPIRQLGKLTRKGIALSATVVNKVTEFTTNQVAKLGRFSQQILSNVWSSGVYVASQALRMASKAESYLGEAAAKLYQYIPQFSYWSDDLFLPALKFAGSTALKTAQLSMAAGRAVLSSSFSLVKSTVKAFTQTVRFASENSYKLAKPIINASIQGLQLGVSAAFEIARPIASLTNNLLRSSFYLGSSVLKAGVHTVSLLARTGFNVLSKVTQALAQSAVSELLRIGGGIYSELATLAKHIPGYLKTKGSLFHQLGRFASSLVKATVNIGSAIALSAGKALVRGSRFAASVIGSSAQALWQTTQRLTGLRSVFPFLTNLAIGATNLLYKTLGKPAIAATSLALKLGGRVITTSAKAAFHLLKTTHLPKGFVSKTISALRDIGEYASITTMSAARSFIKTTGAYLRESSKLLSNLGTLTGQTAKFLFDSSVATTKAVATFGKHIINGTGQVTSYALRSTLAAARFAKSTVKSAGKLLAFAGSVTNQLVDRGIRQLVRYTPGLAKTILAHGYKETFLNVLSPALDLATVGGGVFKAGQLNAYSSLSEVEEAYIQAGAGRGSLVGSVFGLFAMGPLGDVAGSLLGQFIGSEAAKERARLRYEARDYGIVPILEDFVEPLTRDTVLAGYVGKQVGKMGSAAVQSYLQNSLAKIASGKANKLDRMVTAASAAYRQGFRSQVAQATGRFSRVLGHAPGAASIGKLVGGTSKVVTKTAGKILQILGPAIDVTRIGAGYVQSQSARTEAEYQVSVRRTSGGLGSIAGGLIGGALGGPIGAVAGSLLGDFVLDKVGENLAQEAYMRNVSAGTITTGQIAGGVIGAGVGLLAGGLLVGAGLVAAVATAPILLAAAGIGLLVGAVAGGYAMLTGKKKDESKTRLVQAAQRRRARWNTPDALNQPIKKQSIIKQTDNEILDVTKRSKERLAIAQSYLSPTQQPESATNVMTQAKTSNQTQRDQQRQWWSGVYEGVVAVGRKSMELVEGVRSYIKRTYSDFQTILSKVSEFKASLFNKSQKTSAKESLPTTQVEVSDPTDTSTVTGTPVTVKGGVKLNEADAYRLAALAIMEAPTRMGRLDVAQAVFNRINAPKVGAASYGSSVTAVVFASGQFEPYFGVSASEIKNRSDAVSILKRKRGMSSAQANQLLNQFFADVADPAKMAQARKHVGGRTDFKGTTMYSNMVKGEDKLRTYGENFFHIGSGQSYKQLAKLEQLGPSVIVKEGQELPKSVAGSSPPQNLSGRLSGKVVPFKGIIVTSAVDASGEPGLDYVVESGKRGAQFGSLTSGQVIEVVANQNWESHLERGDTRRGYGNRVIVRSKDSKTGEFVDILYAHLDRVNVKKGQSVVVGSVLGTQGRTGSTTGAHVSVDFYAKDANHASRASIAMRDRLARELSRGAPNLNKQVKQTQQAAATQAPATVPTTASTISKSAPTVSTEQNGQIVTTSKLNTTRQSATTKSVNKIASSTPIRIPSGLNARGKKMAQYLANPNVRAVLDTIAYAEGLWGKPGGGYDLGFNYRKISNMSKHPFHGNERTPGGGSSASGRYQAMGHTWAEAARNYGLKDFSPASQDVFAVAKLADRGILERIAAGKINDPFVRRQLGYEWASFEGNPYGQGTSMGSWSKAIPFFHKRVKAYRNPIGPEEMEKVAESFTPPSERVTPTEQSVPASAPTETIKPAHVVSPSNQKRRRKNLHSSVHTPAADVNKLNQAAVVQPVNLGVVEKMLAVVNNVSEQAKKSIKPPSNKQIQVATAQLPQSVASLDTTCNSQKHDCLQAVVAGNHIDLSSLTGYLKDWVSVTGMTSPLEFAS